jgi:hypothetical protein
LGRVIFQALIWFCSSLYLAYFGDTSSSGCINYYTLKKIGERRTKFMIFRLEIPRALNMKNLFHLARGKLDRA